MKQKFFIFACFAVIFATVFGSSVYAVGMENYPDTYYGSSSGITPVKSRAVIYKDTAGDIRAFAVYFNNATSSDQHVMDVVFDGNNLSFTAVIQGTWHNYILNSSGTAFSQVETTQLSATVGNSRLVNSSAVEILASDVNIYDSDGNLVFPQPPAPQMTPLEVAVTEALETLQTKTLTTMEILTLCGVGLMALLVALVILPKVLYKFL